ncbi:MAG: YlzJ-like family protein [Syntrophomonadaceae bacterium]|jgi:hypothetical protein
MIIYLPDDYLWQLQSSNEELQNINIKLPSGGYLQAQPWGEDAIKVISIISTDPMDFINHRYQPGSIIKRELQLD